MIATCLCWWLIGGSAPLFDKATIHETDEMAECIVKADELEAGETEEAQEAAEFEEAGNAEGVAEAEHAEEEVVPCAKQVQWDVFRWFCGYFKLQHRRHKRRMLKTLQCARKLHSELFADAPYRWSKLVRNSVKKVNLERPGDCWTRARSSSSRVCMALSEKAGVTSSVERKVAATELRKHGIETRIS